MKTRNIYTPFQTRIESIQQETADVKLLRVSMPKGTTYVPGQFYMVSVWGAGEVPISITSHPHESELLELCIRKAGFVTSAIDGLQKGEVLWLRGPYGNGFPLEIAQGAKILLVAGGIGMAPLRPLIYEFTDDGKGYGDVTLIYGSRTPEEIIFREEIETYQRHGVHVRLCVDRGNRDWAGHVGLVTDLLGEVQSDLNSAVAYLCGPEIMIKNVTRDLNLMGMPQDRILTTLEAHMKCGVGKCGHCYGGAKYICTDGPVFTYQEILDHRLA
jgi:sulfhydrogenase subunit gamma (sulfur reductase)